MSALCFALIVSMMMVVSACTPAAQKSNTENANTEQKAEQLLIPVTVRNALEGTEQFEIERDAEVPAGATVLDALKATGLEVDIQNSQYGPFVQAINGVAGEGMTGWTYKVNGAEVQATADSTVLSSGDSVEWNYVSFE